MQATAPTEIGSPESRAATCGYARGQTSGGPVGSKKLADDGMMPEQPQTVQQRVLAANVVRSSFVDVDDPADLGLVPLISSGPPEPRPGAKLSEAKTTETSEKKGHLWNTAGAEQEHRGGEDSNVRGS